MKSCQDPCRRLNSALILPEVADWVRVAPPGGRSPLPTNGNGKSSFEMVAGARYTHQKRNFPPVNVIDIQFEYQGGALVPVGVEYPGE